MEVGWIVGIILISIFVVSLAAYLLVKHYVDPRDNSKLTTFVSTFAIVITLFCVLIIPVDIYTVSSSTNPVDGRQTDAQLVYDSGQFVKYLYYSFYILLCVFAFFLLPFAYFFFEEDGENRTDAQRACSALKYTAAFMIVFAVLLTLGLVLRADKGDPSHSWIQKLSLGYSAGDAIISFAISSLAVLGLSGWITYAAYGLANLPVSLLKGMLTGAAAVNTGDARKKKSTTDRGSLKSTASLAGVDLESELKKNRSRIDYIDSKYKLTANAWTPADKAEMAKLRAEERRLQREQDTRERAAASSGRGGGNMVERGADAVGDGCASCWNALAPFRIVIAIPLLLISLLIIVSMLISSIDKFLHSDCKTACGYVLDKPQLPNPLDEVLKFCSKAFPIDFIIFGLLVAYIFICAVMGLVKLGVRFLIFKFYSVRKQKTAPHALLMGAWFLTFTVLVLNMQILVLSPQYATFGTQFYKTYNNATGGMDTQLCSVGMVGDNQTDSCVMTQVATFITKNNIQLPFFGIVLFYANLGFLLMYFVFLAASFCTGNKGEGYDEMDEDNYEV